MAEPPPCPPGYETGPPDFVGVGAFRAGTSWWYRLIVDHPEIAAVGGVRRRLGHGERLDPSKSVPALTTRPVGKELRFFDPFVDGELFAAHAGLYPRFFPRPPGSLAGEWSPNYMSDFWIPRLLARVAPEAKILVLLRDPVERFRSTLGFAATALNLRGTRRSVDIWNIERDRNRYLEQLSRLLCLFDRDQLLVLQYERCCQDPSAELRRTYEFLGVEPGDHAMPAFDERISEGQAKAVLSEDVRRYLVGELASEMRALAERFPEVDLELWPNFRATSSAS